MSLNTKTAIILDTDVGTDDAMALVLLRSMEDLKPDFIIATPGNANAAQAVVNAVALKKLFGIHAVIVKGEAPENIAIMSEKNTFHGPDGLAGISSQIQESCAVSKTDLAACITMKDLHARLTDYDEIIYIAICPLNSFVSLYSDAALKPKFTRLYIMGGGLRAFNCSHNTEFNFSKAPKALKQLLAANLDITLFPLDLTNRYYLTPDEITHMAANGANPFCVSLLKYNMTANESYNNIPGAVLHDALPVLYLRHPDKFTIEETRLSSDDYGAIREDPIGTPVKVAIRMDPRLLLQAIADAICF